MARVVERGGEEWFEVANLKVFTGISWIPAVREEEGREVKRGNWGASMQNRV
jgi:hypothetical protein